MKTFDPTVHQMHLDAITCMIEKNEEGALAIFKQIVRESENINFNHFDEQNNTPLCVAICNEMFAVTEFLLTHGADVNFPGDVQTYPIIYAAALGNIRLFKLLTDRGANCEAQDQHGNTPLIAAINRKHFSMAEFILDHYTINLEQCVEEGLTALHHAVFAKNVSLVKKLLALGANPKAQGIREIEPLDLAFAQARKEGHEINNSFLFKPPQHQIAQIIVLLKEKINEEVRESVHNPSRVRP